MLALGGGDLTGVCESDIIIPMTTSKYHFTFGLAGLYAIERCPQCGARNIWAHHLGWHQCDDCSFTTCPIRTWATDYGTTLGINPLNGDTCEVVARPPFDAKFEMGFNGVKYYSCGLANYAVVTAVFEAPQSLVRLDREFQD